MGDILSWLILLCTLGTVAFTWGMFLSSMNRNETNGTPHEDFEERIVELIGRFRHLSSVRLQMLDRKTEEMRKLIDEANALYSALSVKETEVRASEMGLKQESSRTEDLFPSDHLKQSEHSETEEQEQQVEMSVEKKIMLLSQEGKTDQEIAKLLGIGTGEVRLILSLFAGKNHYSSDSAI